MSKIHVLDKSVYELIAAGEVIERPSAVIKELIENALDAGSTKITVEIKNGGRTYIRVTDNGCGMSAEDVPLAFVRHATSKLSSKEDLDSILTLGFRGEALASICAVARVEVLTKQADATMGYHYQIEASEEIDCGEIGCPNGTTFIVKDLFFNTPARQKFMRKDVSEGNYISDIVQKLALSHPAVSFKFIRDNKIEFVTPGDGKLLSCIYVILGKQFYASCIPVDYSYLNIRITGYITKPLGSFASRANQIFFVNSRYIKCATCQFALEEGYKNRMMVSKYPGCVLNIEIDSEYVDVNYHPSKLQVRFKDESIVYNAVLFAVNNSLMLYDAPAEIKFEVVNEPVLTASEVYAKPVKSESVQQMSFESIENEQTEREEELEKPEALIEQSTVPSPAPEVNKKVKAVLSYDTNDDDNHAQMDKWSFLAKSAKNTKASKKSAQEPAKASEDSMGGFKYINSKSVIKKEKTKDSKAKEKDGSGIPAINVLGEAFKTYIIAECNGDIIFIDKHAAHERYIYEQIKSQQEDLETQMLIEPINSRVSSEIYEAVSENLDMCRKLGLEVKPLPCSFLSISGLPAIADNIEPMDIVERIGIAVLNKNEETSRSVFDDIYHTIACKAAIKAQSDTDKIELKKLLDLVTEEDLRYCPHGRPILIKLSKKEIERMFKRIT